MWKRIQSVLARLRPSVKTGDRGERLAAEWLRRERGFSVIARNWRNPRDRRQEIDLVCRDGEVLVFVEVKTRSPEALVPGYFAVNPRKKRVLLRAIRAYLARLAHPPRTFRFDVVEVVVEDDGNTSECVDESAAEVRHFESVPLFPKRFRR